MQTCHLALLPVEMVDAIFSNLCSVCSSCASHEDEIDINNQVTAASMVDKSLGGKALRSLCLTSQYLSPIAMRHRYHCLSFDPLRRRLVQTLLDRPDLACLVKKVWAYRPLSNWCAEYFQQVFRQAQGKSFQEGMSILGRLCALLPNLERLTAHHHQFNEGNGMPLSMPKLRELRLLSMPRAKSYPGETELIDVRDLAPLFRAAPNITDLYLQFPASYRPVGGLTLDHVTKLELDQAHMDVACLTSFLRLCPNVETLKYSARASSDSRLVEITQFVPRDLESGVSALLEKGELTRLKRIDVRLCQCGYVLCWLHDPWFPQMVMHPMEDLKQVVELRGIVVTVQTEPGDEVTDSELEDAYRRAETYLRASDRGQHDGWNDGS
ncbi:hypothetical protein DL546_002790 [Coniochaeta pulveracea]|uniref:F-box domain-containing protein n=1 Tax=Coniochaeta pulveracea TaxID=177199 RepID=A0A420Y773_9PEZI|nr:hypothetical protein DL546_002790 [Coniochaeta pulveracea]